MNNVIDGMTILIVCLNFKTPHMQNFRYCQATWGMAGHSSSAVGIG